MKRSFALALLASLSLLPGCSREAQQSPAREPVRVENPQLGIAIADLPDAFDVVTAAAETIELVAEGPAGAGRAVIDAGPVQSGGINLIEATKERKAWFESQPGAIYHGNRELGTPIGTAFTARATYSTDSGEIEETWVCAVHPGENRLLTIAYTYPTGETETRIEQLLALLGEIEGIGGG
jgi:hypothetical protein